MNRRAYLGTAIVAFAGCIGSNDNDDGTADAPSETGGTDDDGSSTGDSTTATELERFDDFTDLSRWSVLSGSLDAAPQQGREGTQAARLEAGPADDRVTISCTPSEPIDCSQTNPGLTVATDQTARPIIQLFDASGDRVEFRRGISGNRELMRYNFGLTDVYGEPDLTAVTELRVSLWVGDQSRVLTVDDVHFVPRSDTGTVMIQFDDGYETDYHYFWGLFGYHPFLRVITVKLQ